MVYLLIKNKKNKKTLLPCPNARARRLLKTGQAKVVSKNPFIIRRLDSSDTENVAKSTLLEEDVLSDINLTELSHNTTGYDLAKEEENLKTRVPYPISNQSEPEETGMVFQNKKMPNRKKSQKHPNCNKDDRGRQKQKNRGPARWGNTHSNRQKRGHFKKGA